jgi:hypothetical protein
MDPATPLANDTPPMDTSQPIKRPAERVAHDSPAKRQKVTRACDRCKSRKRRCNGEVPCNVCLGVGAACKYDAVYTRGKLVQPRPTAAATSNTILPTVGYQSQFGAGHQASLRQSTDQDDDGTDEYTGPSSAYAFLKRAWERFGHRESNGGVLSGFREAEAGQSTSIFSFGDRRISPPSHSHSGFPDVASAESLFALYFDFAMPTYRFLHRPTAEAWLVAMHQQRAGKPTTRTVTPSQQSVVWMVLATALLFNSTNAESREVDAEDYFGAAKTALSAETGRAKLESVQARLAMCLYLLHTGRPNEAWYTFGSTVQLSFALGMHRAGEDLALEDPTIKECRKRTFWAIATLDSYISIMLGRPSLINDRDVNQRYPRAIDDDELEAGSKADLVRDRVISASILHARLAQIAKKAAQEQSNPQQSDDTRASIAATTNEKLSAWQQSMPVLLSGAVHPSSLIPIFRRQTMVLRLAHAHALMLVNRPLLLADSVQLPELKSNVVACIGAAKVTLDMLTGTVRVDCYGQTNILLTVHLGN